MKQKTHAGFTIIELMLTIAVASVLLAVGIPAFRDMIMNNCLTTKANSYVSAMQSARSTAITYRENVTVGSISCHMDDNDDDAADDSCTTTDEFGEGVVVFRDIDADGLADSGLEDANGNGALDPGEDLNGNGILDAEILREVEFGCAATMNETTLTGIDSIDNSTSFVYEPDGSATPRATIDICDERPSAEYTGRRITLSATGRPTTDSSFTCP